MVQSLRQTLLEAGLHGLVSLDSLLCELSLFSGKGFNLLFDYTIVNLVRVYLGKNSLY